MVRHRSLVEQMGQDVRYAVRVLLKARGFALVTVLTLAVGIGVTTAAYSLLDAWLLRPLHFPEADRLVVIVKSDRQRPDEPALWAGYRDFLGWSGGSDAFDSLAAVFSRSFVLTGAGDARSVGGLIATPNLFETLGLTAERGRTFTSADATGEPAVVLGAGLWQELGGRPDIVGATVTLNGTGHRVLGVLPGGRGLRLLDQASDAPLYVMLQPGDTGYGPHDVGPVAGIGRLKAGASLAAARAELAAIQERLDREYPDNPEGYTPHLAWLQADNARTVRASLLALAGAALLVLLLVCTNVTSLFVGRTTLRRREMAVRAALGAGRARVIRQMLTESGLLALVGGTAGVLLAYGLIQLFVALDPFGTLPANRIAIDHRVLVVALLVTGAAAVVVGLMPALDVSRVDLARLLGGGHRTTRGAGSGHLRNLLVVAQVAMSMVLLVCALLLIQTLHRLRGEPLGFETRAVTAVSLSLPDELKERAGGLVLAAVGLALGVVAALSSTRVLSTLLYGIRPADPRVFVAVSVVLLLAAVAGSYLPARRAARVDPSVALRST